MRLALCWAKRAGVSSFPGRVGASLHSCVWAPNTPGGRCAITVCPLNLQEILDLAGPFCPGSCNLPRDSRPPPCLLAEELLIFKIDFLYLKELEGERRAPLRSAEA